MPKYSRSFVFAALATLVGCGGGSAASRSAFTLLPSSGAAFPTAASPDGSLVAGKIGPAATAAAVVWNLAADPQGVTPSQSGGRVTINAITNSGAIFGSETTDGGTTNAPETATSVSGTLTPLPLPAGVTSATVADVSEDGTVVLGRSASGLFVTSGGTASALSDSANTAALLSGDGKVAFLVNGTGVVKRVLATGVSTTVVPSSGSPTLAGVGLTGTTITGALNVGGTANTHTYRLVNSTFSDLGTLGSDVSSYPVGIDRSGATVVGVSTSSSGVARPYVWRTSTGKMISLSKYASFGSLTNVVPTGISADGSTVFGYGTENAGTGSETTRAWKIRL